MTDTAHALLWPLRGSGEARGFWREGLRETHWVLPATARRGVKPLWVKQREGRVRRRNEGAEGHNHQPQRSAGNLAGPPASRVPGDMTHIPRKFDPFCVGAGSTRLSLLGVRLMLCVKSVFSCRLSRRPSLTMKGRGQRISNVRRQRSYCLSASGPVSLSQCTGRLPLEKRQRMLPF